MYALISILSAFLLFFLQPFIAKVLTPYFGGSAKVWILSLIFFQSLLLGAYAYAHFLAMRVRPNRQIWIHGALLILALFSLAWTWSRSGYPMLPSTTWTAPPTQETMTFPLLLLLLQTVGLPYFALSATSPLIQSWFVHRFRDKSPYALYAASNAGSLVGLLAYPLLAEPYLSRGAQSILIAAAFLLFAFLMFFVGRGLPESSSTLEKKTAKPQMKSLCIWVLAAGTGSMLLLSGTHFLTASIANIPMLWVLPLVAYLLTFILWFDARWLRSGPGSHAGLTLLFLATLIYLYIVRNQPAPVWMISALFLVVGSGCLVSHGLLYATRPSSEYLTAYYLAISIGGALGGLLIGVAAPRFLNRVYEFPFSVALCGLSACLWAILSTWPKRRALALLSVFPFLAGMGGLLREARQPGLFFRDDYGVLKVLESGPIRVIYHGNILHGIERADRPREPLAFFSQPSGIGKAFSLLRSRKPQLKVGVIGLGLGSVAGYGQSGDYFRFYEISPKVVDLSVGAKARFHTIHSSLAQIHIETGDGRLLLDRELRQGSQNYDLLMVDAFTGGSIPWHLLTLESFRTYLAHLDPEGILVIHLSNRLPIDRLVNVSARHLNLWALAIDHPSPENPQKLEAFQSHSNYVLLTKGSTLSSNDIVRSASWMTVPNDWEVRMGPKSYAKWQWGLQLGKGLKPWTDERNSLTDLLWAGRPAYAEGKPH